MTAGILSAVRTQSGFSNRESKLIRLDACRTSRHKHPSCTAPPVLLPKQTPNLIIL